MHTLAKLWRWSWLVTLPLFALGAVWLLPAGRDARQFLVFHPASLHRSSDVDLNLRQILMGRLATLAADVGSSWKSRWAAGLSPLGRVDLEVAPADQAVLDGNLPKSGKEGFVPGLLRFPGGGFEEVGLRYRGDSIHHWGLAAKSWLVRTEKDQLIQGQRRWHVVLPRWRSAANYFVNLQMARRMGVLAGEPTLVNLRVNGRQHGGVHLLEPQQDEVYLRQKGLLPGDLFVGDMTPLDDNYVNEAPHGGMWELPWLWQKAAANPNTPTAGTRPLELLFFQVYHGSAAALRERLDLPAWAKFSAYMTLFAGEHMDMGHNWKLYLDPASGKFLPLVGDGNGLPDNVLEMTAALPGRDVSITTPLLVRLHQDHAFLRLKNEALTAFFRDGLDREFFANLEHFRASVAPTLAVFPQIDWMGSVEGRPIHYFDDGDLADRIRAVTPALTTWFEEQRWHATLDPKNIAAAPAGPATWRLQVQGFASVRVGLRLPAGATTPSLRLVVHRPGAADETVDATPLLRREGDTVWLDWALLAARSVGNPTLGGGPVAHATAAATYDLELAGLPAGQCTPVARGDLTAPFAVATLASLPAVAVAAGNTGLLPALPVPVQWSGEVALAGTTEIRGSLFIAAGTTIRLGPGASLIVHGRVTAVGTAAQPVRFIRAQPNAPWGAVVLEGADGSRFEQCEFTGGAGWSSPFESTPAMLSVRAARDVSVHDSRLTGSPGTTDLLEGISAGLEINRTEFRGAVRTGLSLQHSDVRLRGITVTAAGHSGLNLQGSQVMLSGSLIGDNRLNGLVASWAARLLVIDTRIQGSGVGLLAEDASNVSLYNVTFGKNQLQVSAGLRNAAYLGNVAITLAKSVVSPAVLAFDVRDQARLTVLDSRIDRQSLYTGITADDLSDAGETPRSAEPANSLNQLLPGPDWQTTNPRIRGALSPAPASPKP